MTGLAKPREVQEIMITQVGLQPQSQGGLECEMGRYMGASGEKALKVSLRSCTFLWTKGN